MTNGAASIAVVTSAPGRPRDEDLAPLVAALQQLGAAVSVVDWDDPAADWSAFDLAVIRSTWDYTVRYEEFLQWCDRCAAHTRLVNHPRVIRWNTDKRYLTELVEAGVSVVPTTFVESETVLDGPGFEMPRGEQFVVKPTVSAGSRDTVRYVADDVEPAVEQARALLRAGRPVMVQPYQHAVDADGETALLFFGGEFSHAIRKGALLEAGQEAHRALFAEEHITPATPTDAQLELALACLAALGNLTAFDGIEVPLPYARVDVLEANDGTLAILELELTEPSLFFDWAPGAADRYATVLMGLARSRPEEIA